MSDFDPWHSAVVASDIWMAGVDGIDTIRDRQRRRLAALLAAARRGTRLHAERLREFDADAPLEQLPRMDKGTLMERFEDGIADPALTLDGVRRFVADPRLIGTAHLGRYTVWESSGSTGEPGLFVQDAAAMAVYDALEALRRARRAWPDPLGLAALGQRQCFVGAIDGHFASEVSMQRLRRLNPWLSATLRSFSILQPPADLVAQLNAWQPAVLATYPTAAVMLAGEQRRGRLKLSLRELLTGGETLAPAQRADVEQAFGCTLRNSYGASEFLAIGSECAHGRLHVNADWVILEPVDARGRAVSPGTLSHTTLVTNLANPVQPIIRFDLGDRTRWVPGPCPCGSPLPVVEVKGRDDDVLRMQGAAGDDATLLPLALSTVLEEEAGEFDFQVRQLDRRTLSLQLGHCDDPRDPRLARCESVLRRFARSQGVKACRIVVRTGEPMLLGRSGKRRRVMVG